MKTKPASNATIAACAFEILEVDGAIQLFPTRAFAARDGRPFEVSSRQWVIDAQIAASLISRVAVRATDVVMDYEHPTLNSVQNGKPAPATAWLILQIFGSFSNLGSANHRAK